MRDLYARSFMHEFGSALVLGAIVVFAVVALLSVFTSPDPVLMADNSVQITAPVTEDTPGPILNDSGVPDREVARTSPLSDRNR
jgi:hypothetical protein